MVKLIDSSFKLIDNKNNETVCKKIELVARNCYQSEGNITEDSCYSMVEKLIKLGHTAMLEHETLTVQLITDVGAYKDLTRHRLAAYAIESTRWCNYTGEKFGRELTFIKPCHIPEGTDLFNTWLRHRQQEEDAYFSIIDEFEKNPNIKVDDINVSKVDVARMELSHSLKASVMITANIREWRHIFTVRCDSHAHPTLRTLMRNLLVYFICRFPTLFGDLIYLVQDRFEVLNKQFEDYKERASKVKFVFDEHLEYMPKVNIKHYLFSKPILAEKMLDAARIVYDKGGYTKLEPEFDPEYGRKVLMFKDCFYDSKQYLELSDNPEFLDLICYINTNME